MGLFNKNVCSICGNTLGMFDTKKCADGEICKNCESQISPYVLEKEKRNMTIANIKDHLNYRITNRNMLERFVDSGRVGGANSMIHIDSTNGWIIFTKSSNWKQENPDIITFDQISGIDFSVNERIDYSYTTRNGYKYETKNYFYNFHFAFYINNQWFQEISFNINDYDIAMNETAKFKVAYEDAEEIINYFSQYGIQINCRDNTSLGADNVLSGNIPQEAYETTCVQVAPTPPAYIPPPPRPRYIVPPPPPRPIIPPPPPRRPIIPPPPPPRRPVAPPPPRPKPPAPPRPAGGGMSRPNPPRPSGGMGRPSSPPRPTGNGPRASASPGGGRGPGGKGPGGPRR